MTSGPTTPNDKPIDLAARVAADLSPFGMALGEMLRTLDNMDKRLSRACQGSKTESQAAPTPHGEKSCNAKSPASRSQRGVVQDGEVPDMERNGRPTAESDGPIRVPA